MKAYVSDTEDLKLDPSYKDTWDDMIINVCLFFSLSFFFLFGGFFPPWKVVFNRLK